MFPWVGTVMPRLVMGVGLLCRFGLEGLDLDVEPCEASVVFGLAVEAVGFRDCDYLYLVACFVLEEAHPHVQGAYFPQSQKHDAFSGSSPRAGSLHFPTSSDARKQPENIQFPYVEMST